YHEESLCVCDLSDVLEMKIPAVSQHLRKLKDAGLLEPRREGTVIYYNITSDYQDTVHTLLQLMSKALITKAG
ncbi:MAG: metalloregulator ArsR/SmtB family transcription factor, partial [Saprospiraceae bacterium]|nr:metalloregulator ArsR/SmtB family transcription factor [Saprospiraceae bacterium]